MKKAFLYLFLFSLCFLKSSNAFSLASSQNNAIEEIQNWNSANFKSSQNLPSIVKSDFINDFDNENENDDCDTHTPSLKNKTLILASSSCENYSARLNFVFKILSANTYFLENCSQIKSCNFLTLRVLRL